MSVRSRTSVRPAVPAPTAERGASLVEILIAVTILAIGVLGVGRIFPTSNRVQTQDRLTNTASYYAQQKLEEVLTFDWNDPEMQVGRYPAVDAESLGTNQTWLRHYEVDAMAEPLDNLRKVTVTVAWNYHGARSVTAVTYKRR